MRTTDAGEIWMLGTGFAIWPCQLTDGRWIWMRPYFWVSKEWGWSFYDEWRFAYQAEAEAFWDRVA